MHINKHQQKLIVHVHPGFQDCLWNHDNVDLQGLYMLGKGNYINSYTNSPQIDWFLECGAITDILIWQEQVENMPDPIADVHPRNQ